MNRSFFNKIVSFFVLSMLSGVMATMPSEAAQKKYKKVKVTRSPYLKPAYAAIVMDADSGEIFHTDTADDLRHPASLTKMMTLYVLFKELQNGKIKMNTQMPVSAHAAGQEPTKLGVKAGGTLSVSHAIQALVTKSANDAAVVVAEYLSGTESHFSEKMTQQARLLGMNRTTFKNASGLPNPYQITSARDMAKLSRALYKDFPQFFNYFRLKSFNYKGENHRNHNHLLGKVSGVDGFKTGYTAASGFNLAATAERYDAANKKHRLIVVVLGGPTRFWRDQRVESLLETHFQKKGIGEARLMEATYRQDSSELDTLVQEMAPDQKPKLQQARWVQPPHVGVALNTPKHSAGKWRVQVGAYGNKKDALAAATSAQATIQKGSAIAQSAKNGKKYLHLAQVQGLSQETATKLCKTLKSKGQDCLLLS